LRNLANENPPYACPQNVALVGATLPILLGGICAVIANAATPEIAIFNNPLALFCIFLSGAACVFAFVPKIFKWDWRARYFGISMIYLASASLLGIIPWLCMVLYSSQPGWVRLFFLLAYALPIIWWCRRFLVFYRNLILNNVWRDFIYKEDDDAIYYIQRNDNWLIEKRYKLAMFPSNALTVVPLALAFVLVPFMKFVNAHIGLPFAHTFLTVAGLPIIMIFLGFGMRGYLIFYFYPWKIKKATGKEVYVDMVTKTAAPKIK
jgi:MFS family permease